MQIRTCVAAVGACMLFIPAFCAEPPAVIEIGRELIKEGRTAAHEKSEADFVRAFRRAKFPYHYVALSAMSGPNEVWFVSAYPSFAAMEESDKIISSGPMKNEVDLLDSRDAEARTTSRTMIAVYRKDLSYKADQIDVGKTRYLGISTMRVKLGHDADFKEGSNAFLAAYEKSGFPLPTATYQVIAGAPEGMYLFLMPMESLKSMDSFPQYDAALAQAMGPEKFQQMMKGMGDVFVSSEFSMFRVSPGMSYVSKETEDEDPAFWRPRPPAPPKPEADKPKPGK